MQKVLIKKLKISHVESAKGWLTEDPQTQAEREQLTIRRNRLEDMRKYLHNMVS